MSEESSEELSANTPDTTKSSLTLEEARGKGFLIHDLPPPLTSLLAEHGMYTTTELRHTESLREYLKDINRERALHIIAERVYERLRDVEGFQDAVEKEELGDRLAETFGKITAIEAHDIHVPQSNVAKDDDTVSERGTVVAGKMIFSVPTQEASVNLSSALQVLLQARKGTPVVNSQMQLSEETGEPQYTVALKINEHQIRSLSRSVSAVAAMEDKKKYGLTLPVEKLPLKIWEAEGETFPPEIRGRMEAANSNYRQQLRLSYEGRDLEEDKKTDLLGTEAAAALQGMRDIMNNFIHRFRKRYTNPEQDPDSEARPFLEDEIELKRDPVLDIESQRGPQTSRTLTAREKARSSGEKVYKNARKNPFYTLLEVAKVPFSGGIEWGLTGLQHSGKITKPIKQFFGDIVTWRRQTEEAINTGKHIDAVVKDIKFWQGDSLLDSFAEDISIEQSKNPDTDNR